MTDEDVAAVPTAPQRRISRRTLVRIGGTLIFLAVIVFVLRVKPDELWHELTQANPLYVGASIVLVFPFIALKAWRWQLILRDLGLPVPFGVAYRLYAIGLAAGAITPGQAGDAIKAWQLRDYGRRTGKGESYDLTNGLISVVLDRLFDVAALMILAAAGAAALGSGMNGALPTIVVVTLGVIAGTVFLASTQGRAHLINRVVAMAQQKIGKAASSAAPTRTGEEGAVARRTEVQRVRLLPVCAVTLLSNVVVLVRIWLLALALGMPLKIFEVIAASSLGTVAALLPISVGGVGTRDFTLVTILQNYSREQAVGLSTLVLLLNVVNLLVGGITWLRTRRGV